MVADVLVARLDLRDKAHETLNIYLQALK